MSDYELLKKEMEQNQEAVNQALAEVKDQNTEIAKKLERIEVGLFGDPKMNYVGLIEKQRLLEERIQLVEREYEAFKLTIKVKSSVVDSFELWAKRIFWVILGIAALTLWITGKMGLIEIVKAF